MDCVPLLARGGTYRATLRGGRLRVESPHRFFGPAFEVALEDVAQLIQERYDDSPDVYEVRTSRGETFPVYRDCALVLFPVLRGDRSGEGWRTTPAPAAPSPGGV